MDIIRLKPFLIREGMGSLVLTFETLHHCLGSRMHLKFLINPADICPHRVQTDIEVSGDLFVKATLSELLQYLFISDAELS